MENITRGNMIYEGKANTLYETNHPYVLEMECTNRISAGNGEKTDLVDGKGLANSIISTELFKAFEEGGVSTHFIQEGSNKASKFVCKANMIPLEIIGRFASAGSFCERYGFRPGVKFDNMVIELSYKNDELGDPFISDSCAVDGLKILTKDQLDYIETCTYLIGSIAKSFFAKLELTLVDFKVEFGFDAKTGHIMLCDEFSPDTCRLWDKDGNSLDKDVFRQDLGNVEETYAKILEIVTSKQQN